MHILGICLFDVFNNNDDGDGIMSCYYCLQFFQCSFYDAQYEFIFPQSMRNISKCNSIYCRYCWSVILTFPHYIHFKTILSNFQGPQSTYHNVIRRNSILIYSYLITIIK